MGGGVPSAEHGGSCHEEPAVFSQLARLFRPAPADAVARPVPQPGPPDDEPPRGCGWFDSSHELMSGVLVWEGIIVVDNTVATPS